MRKLQRISTVGLMAILLTWAGHGKSWAAAPMPDPGGTPDYYTTPNWANSPPLRKFVDTLPGLNAAGTNNLGQYIPVAIPDTTTYPGSDYYEIELGRYSEQMHSDLPPTTQQGYRQVNTNDATVKQFHHLGPMILATKNRPVRVKFINSLPPNSKLFVPVDTTIMGSGPYEIDYDPETKAPIPLTSGDFAQTRATLHLHGGRTPWISDGTPHQWITPAGENTSYPKGVSVSYVPDMWFDGSGNTIVECAGQTTCATPGASNNPGPGAQTFYWTNQQSSRLMFYHDHAWGITRLNVYVGEAAGYLISDQTEQDLLNAGTIPADQIPLIFEDKTFVDENTITQTDPTWNWGSQPGWAVKGDLWWPHVYMPAQNPYNPDMSGVNALGRWHYGPWFWPPTPVCGSSPNAIKPFCVAYGPVPNPLYDPSCDPATAPNGFCQPPENPGTPNPSWGAEAFLDTPVVNGTAYPKLTVQPKTYRFRILNAAHDRFINLQLYMADGTQVNPACPTCAANTEVKMVPASPRSDCSATLSTDCVCTTNFSPADCFPATWPTDGREGGVPDPAMAGPEFVQIATEGGFLPQPVVLPNQPISYNMDVTMFNVGNVNGGTLILGPAERADVIVDFSQYAGKTLILYNDAPTAFPALDPHYDYYTGDPDRTDIGGAPSTPVGLGPNDRTIMQINVAAATPAPAYDLAALQAKFTSAPGTPGVFEQSQAPIIVGQSDYDTTYADTTNNTPFPSTWPNWGKSRISDTALSFRQPDGTTYSNFPMKPKAIHDEMGGSFDEYGRMSAKLGLEVPNSNAAVSSFVLQNYVDPATEIVGNDEIQIWKITHNGVDTHPIHFHLFEVQVLNRVGWDGFIRPPDPNELGWKDTVRISPLEDTIVALRAVVPTVPFRLPDSIRPLDPSHPLNDTTTFTNLDPSGQRYAPAIKNELYNFGWEYVWHCHILSHEENDMMRPIVAVAIDAPTGLALAPGNPAGVELSWTDNSHNETGFVAQRATDAAFTQNLVTFADQPASAPNTDFGGTLNMTDATTVAGTQYYYRVKAINDYGSATRPNIFSSAWSNIAVSSGKSMLLTPSTLAFGNQPINAASASQNITVTNNGTVDLSITGFTLAGAGAAVYSQTNDCPVAPAVLAPAATCTVAVTFTPTAVGAAAATLTVDETDPLFSQTATLSGTGVSATPTVSPLSRSFSNQVITTTSTPQLVTIRNGGTVPITVSSIGLAGANPGDFAQTNTCGALPRVLNQAASCTVSVTFTPTVEGARSATLAIDSLSVTLTGTGTAPVIGVAPGSLTFGDQVITTSSPAQTITVSNTGTGPLTINTVSLAGVSPDQFSQTNNCTAAPLPALTGTCTINVTFAPTVANTPLTALLNINVGAPAISQSLTVSGTGTLPVAAVAPGSLTFGDQMITTASPAQTITVSNTGTGPLTINTVSLAGVNPDQFSQTNNCTAAPLPALTGTCTINVTFAPTVANTPLTALLNVDVGAPAVSQSVTVSGTGTLPVAAVAPGSLTFGDQVITTASPAQTITVSNTGTGPLTINTVSLAGVNPDQFAQTNNCTAAPLPALTGTCTINVTFAPTVANTPLTALLNINVGAPAVSQSVTVSGTGTLPITTVSPASNAFGNQLINTLSAPRTITVSNSGTGPLTLRGITLAGTDPGQFLKITTCGATLAANATCTVQVRFRPTTTGLKTATLAIDVDTPALSKTVPLSGTGTLPAATVTPTTLTFANQLINTASIAQTVTVKNSGTAPLGIVGISLAGVSANQYALAFNNCPATLAPAKSCSVRLTFKPTSTGTKNATLQVAVAAPASNKTVSLRGVGIAPASRVVPASISFGNQLINTASTAKTVSIRNTGSAPMTITGVTLSGTNSNQFVRSTTCKATLAAGTACSATVTFKPTTVGAKRASLDVIVAAPAVSKHVALTGTGTAPVSSVTPATLLFTGQTVNTTSAPQTVTVKNTGTAPMAITGISLTGTNSNQFIRTTTCGASLASGATCTVKVSFRPNAIGPKSAALNINVAAPATNKTVTLSGSGKFL